MSEANRNPELFDPKENLTEEECQQIRRATDTLLNAFAEARTRAKNRECAEILSKDPEYDVWSEARHREAIEAQDKEHRGCFFSHEGCSLDTKTN